jgi:hypothetical protein
MEIDIIDIISNKSNDIEKLINEDFITVGIFIDKIVIKDNFYILIANGIKGLNLIKIHLNDFFEESCLAKNKLLLITNATLKAIYLPSEKIFSVFKVSPDFKDYSKLIISMETTNFTSMKLLPGSKFTSKSSLN